MHGDNITMYRTFNNLSNNANVSIHTWLLSLEERYWANGNSLPDTLFHQVDGGPENANETFHALCALMVSCCYFPQYTAYFYLLCFVQVSKRLTRKIVLSRLLVGHTHEDIDAIFALIWKKLFPEQIYDPDQFKVMCPVYVICQ